MGNNDLKRTDNKLDQRSRELRAQVIRVFQSAGRGHLGAAFSLIEIVRVLYDDVLNFDSKNPLWVDRDRSILSKGHGCLALYVMLADKGFFPEQELWSFCKSDGLLGGHPEIVVPGVEASTGSLGHGLSIGIGFALNGRYENKKHRVFVTLGDGECNEGSVWEAAMCAGKHKLSNLTVIVDYNKNQSYGSTYEVQDLEPFADKWKAFGFGVREVNGHDVDALRQVLTTLPENENKPTAVICHTVKGKGIKEAENNMLWHHKSKMADEDINKLFQELEIV